MSDAPGRDVKYSEVCPRVQCQNEYHRLRSERDKYKAALERIIELPQEVDRVAMDADIAREALKQTNE